MNRALNQHYHKISRKVLASQFIYRKASEILQIKEVILNVYSKRVLKLHLLYLYLLTGKPPYAKKFISQAIFSRYPNTSKSQIITNLHIRSLSRYQILQDIMLNIIPRQPYTELKIFKNTCTHIQLILQDSTVYDKMLGLLGNRGTYLNTIPIKVMLKFSTVNFKERVFFLALLKIITKNK